MYFINVTVLSVRLFSNILFSVYLFSFILIYFVRIKIKKKSASFVAIYLGKKYYSKYIN